MISGDGETDQQVKQHKLIHNIKTGIISREVGLNFSQFVPNCQSDAFDLTNADQPDSLKDPLQLFQLKNADLVGTPEIQSINVFDDSVFKQAT